MVEVLVLFLSLSHAMVSYCAMSRVVLSFVFIILLRVTVPRIKVEAVSRWGWVIGWALAFMSLVFFNVVWLIF